MPLSRVQLLTQKGQYDASDHGGTSYSRFSIPRDVTGKCPLICSMHLSPAPVAPAKLPLATSISSWSARRGCISSAAADDVASRALKVSAQRKAALRAVACRSCSQALDALAACVGHRFLTFGGAASQGGATKHGMLHAPSALLVGLHRMNLKPCRTSGHAGNRLAPSSELQLLVPPTHSLRSTAARIHKFIHTTSYVGVRSRKQCSPAVDLQGKHQIASKQTAGMGYTSRGVPSGVMSTLFHVSNALRCWTCQSEAAGTSLSRGEHADR